MIMIMGLLPAATLFLLFHSVLTYNYPSAYHGKRLGGGSSQRLRSYDPHSYQSIMAQRYPVNYYKVYPYNDNYPTDYYYTQDMYPMYYPPRASKYEIYQAVLPYYFQEPYTRPTYNYYDDPLVDLQDEIQAAEREQREEAQPIGHESFYENDDSRDESYADINAAFLQNLILSQMYQDSLEKEKQAYEGYNDYNDNYEKNEEATNPKASYPSEDEDVRELKQLPKQGKNRQLRKQKQRKYRQQQNLQVEEKRSDYVPGTYQGTMVYVDRKPMNSLDASISTTEASEIDVKGQKEEFQMRPATPVRHPFASPVLAMISNNEKEKKRTPSVYDTIKHMLDMEKSLENSQAASEMRPAMKKRIITPEENLIRQLTVLKKAQ